MQQLTGYRTMPAVERCLRSQGIRYFYGRCGIWTTLDLVNAAGGLRPDPEGNAYPPSIIP